MIRNTHHSFIAAAKTGNTLRTHRGASQHALPCLLAAGPTRRRISVRGLPRSMGPNFYRICSRLRTRCLQSRCSCADNCFRCHRVHKSTRGLYRVQLPPGSGNMRARIGTACLYCYTTTELLFSPSYAGNQLAAGSEPFRLPDPELYPLETVRATCEPDCYKSILSQCMRRRCATSDLCFSCHERLVYHWPSSLFRPCSRHKLYYEG